MKWIKIKMALNAAIKQEIINKYATSLNDTGSPEVQVALLSQRISDLTKHLKEHKHDHHTRRGLMGLVGKRKRLLGFLKNINIDRYRILIDNLGLRR